MMIKAENDCEKVIFKLWYLLVLNVSANKAIFRLILEQNRLKITFSQTLSAFLITQLNPQCVI